MNIIKIKLNIWGTKKSEKFDFWAFSLKIVSKKIDLGQIYFFIHSDEKKV